MIADTATTQVPAGLLQSLQLQVEDLRAALQDAQDGQENLSKVVQDIQANNMALKRELEDLSIWLKETEENQFIQAKLIADLQKGKEPQPRQKDRGEILRALLAANGGKMLQEEARKVMGISKSRFSELLATQRCEVEVRPSRTNRRRNILILK